MTQMQGMVSILRSNNHENITRAASLRRTLSADMSSKKLLAENGLPMKKKIASSEQISVNSSSSSESDEVECEVNGKGDENPRRIDIWTAIMSQKKQDNSGKFPPPYVHPLVKKSASSLSEKSLKVCTESLGSETGSDVSLRSETPRSSDVLSSHPSSKTGDEQQEEKEEHKVVKVACLITKKPQQARFFPPPLPSLAAAHTEGPLLHMHSRRVDGRLVLEAVSVPQQKYFEAQRQDGRFLLTLINNPEDQPSENGFVDVFNLCEEEKSPNYDNKNNDKDDVDEEEEYEDEDEDENEDEDEDEDENEDEIENDFGILKEQPLNTTFIVINGLRSMGTIKKKTERDNENPWWSRKLKTKVSNYLSKVDDVEEEEAPITKSLPPRPRAAGLPPLPPPTAANSVNSYQYFWRAKPTVASVIDPMITQHRPPTKNKDLVLLRGNKADCSFIPSLKGCKEARRSFLMWEPFCMATS